MVSSEPGSPTAGGLSRHACRYGSSAGREAVEFGRVRRASVKSPPRRLSVPPATWSFAPTGLRTSGSISAAAEFRRMCTCFGRCRRRIQTPVLWSATLLLFQVHHPRPKRLSSRPRQLRPLNRPPLVSWTWRPHLRLRRPSQPYQRPPPKLPQSRPSNHTAARPTLGPGRAPGGESRRFSGSIRHSRLQPIR